MTPPTPLRATVLIPAHNEAAVIARTLAPLQALVQEGTIALIIVANACSDETASVAAQTCPKARIVITPIGGKTHAMNLGLADARADLPLVCLDADLILSANAVLALVSAIEAGALAAIGQMHVDSIAASPAVRAYQRAWAHNPYFTQGKFGGVYALAPQAVASLFPLPQVLGDDEFLRRSIAPQHVAFVPACQFTAQSPRSIASLFATRKRALRGARQLASMGLTAPKANVVAHMARASMTRPQALIDLAVFVAIGLALRVALALEPAAHAHKWERDLTTRKAGATA
jgi:glycosyltransferase involved in cell wall biosynthesis